MPNPIVPSKTISEPIAAVEKADATVDHYQNRLQRRACELTQKERFDEAAQTIRQIQLLKRLCQPM